MWPWAHAAVGYLAYSLSLRHRPAPASIPSGPAVVVLGVGTQLPDLVDKTLAWYLDVLPSGRSLGHSLVVGVVVAGAVLWWARRTDHAELGRAFAVGYLAHPFADALHPAVTGDWAFLAFLLWPVLPSPPYAGPERVLAYVVAIRPTPLFLFGLALTGVAAVLWARHGFPGLGTLRRGVTAIATGQ